MFADAQRGDGSIPSSPYLGFSTTLIDYPAYWVEASYDYVLHTGDVAYSRRYHDVLVRLLDGWYASQARHDGLIVNRLGPMDYGYIRRTGTVVTYYNAIYARALALGAALAGWVGDVGRAAAWKARSSAVARRTRDVFWDPAAGAFQDAEGSTAAHPQDGNAFAILAGADLRRRRANGDLVPRPPQPTRLREHDGRVERVRRPSLGDARPRAGLSVHLVLRGAGPVRGRPRRVRRRAGATRVGLHASSGATRYDLGGDRPVWRRLSEHVYQLRVGVVSRSCPRLDRIRARDPSDVARLCDVHRRSAGARSRVGEGRGLDARTARSGSNGGAGRTAARGSPSPIRPGLGVCFADELSKYG